MQRSSKLKIKEAENCMNPSLNEENLIKMLSSMADDQIFPDQQIENQNVSRQMKEESQENMIDIDAILKREQEKQKKKQNVCLGKVRKKSSENHNRKLKELVHKIKVENLVNNFMKKISMNNTERDPVDYNPFNERKIDKSRSLDGLQIPGKLVDIFYFISILNTFVMMVIFSMSILFKEALNSQAITGVQTWGVIWLMIEIGVNFVRVSYGKGYHKLEKLHEIAQNYFRSKFAVDFICLLALFLDILFEEELMIIARSAFLFKAWDCMGKIQALETKLLNTSYKENCWGLVKIFLTNFIIAHFLTVILIMISWLNTKKNWLSKVDAIEAPWDEQYCWAYYWGTTIMFTVGFGDISPVNHKEAMFVMLIQAFSCIYLAYNINCVGTLFSNIRAEDVEKQKKQKILKHLSDKNNISEDLTAKISNYIEECANIKKNFNLQEDSAFISGLPSSIKTSFLRQSNKKIFDSLPFFSTLTESTLLKLAEKLEMFIAHPEQIIEKKDDPPKVMILKQGTVAFCSKMRDSDFNNTVIDYIQIEENEKPHLLSFDFLNPIKIKNYIVNSKEYSVFYSLDIQTLKEILSEKNRDWESFFYLRDKSKHVIDEFQLKKCQFCTSNHLKFRCPKLHYMPIAQEIIYKHLITEKKNRRKKYNREKKSLQTFLYNWENIKFFLPSISSSISKSEKSLLEQLKIKGLESNSGMEEILSVSTGKKPRSQSEMIEDAVSTVKNELMFYLNSEHNWFWEVESDTIKDYQYYFSESNGKDLAKRRRGKEKGGESMNSLKTDKVLQIWK